MKLNEMIAPNNKLHSKSFSPNNNGMDLAPEWIGLNDSWIVSLLTLFLYSSENFVEKASLEYTYSYIAH